MTMFSEGTSVRSFGKAPTYGFPFLSVTLMTILEVCPRVSVFLNDGDIFIVYLLRKSSPSLLALFNSMAVPCVEAVLMLSTEANAISFFGRSLDVMLSVASDFCVVVLLLVVVAVVVAVVVGNAFCEYAATTVDVLFVADGGSAIIENLFLTVALASDGNAVVQRASVPPCVSTHVIGSTVLWRR